MNAARALCLVAGCFIGCAPRLAWRLPAPDHRTEVEVRPHHGRACVRVGGRPEGCFDGIATRGVIFSADSRHVAYPALRDGRWCLVRDGVAGPDWDGVASPVFSEDGEHLAYAALEGTAWRVVRDDRAGEPWDALVENSLQYDRSGTRLAYAAWRGGRVGAVLDGVPGSFGDTLRRLRFSPGGERLAWIAGDEGGERLVVDDRAGAAHDEVTEFVFGPDGRRVYRVARDGSHWSVVDGEVAFGPYAAVRGLASRPTDGAVVFIAGLPQGEAVVVGGTAGPTHASVDAPAFGPPGGSWGYIAHDGDSCDVVIDDRFVRREARASDLSFGSDGRRHAYLAWREGEACVVDESGAHPFDLLIEGTLLFCRDGKAWGCLAGDRRERKLFVVVEGCAERREVDWGVLTRLTRRAGSGDDANPGAIAEIRAWIAAEAELLREQALAGP